MLFVGFGFFSCYSSLQAALKKFSDSVVVQSSSVIVTLVWQHCTEQDWHFPAKQVFMLDGHAVMSTRFQMACLRNLTRLFPVYFCLQMSRTLWGLSWVKTLRSVPALQPQAPLALKQLATGLLDLQLLIVPVWHRLHAGMNLMD